MIKVVHIITSLTAGGAQMMLFKLLSHIDRTAFDSDVISLTSSGALTEPMRSVATRVTSMDLDMRPSSALRIWPLGRLLAEANPDIIQTWLYHADLFGGLAGRLATRAPVLWNIRSGPVERERLRKSRRAILYAGAKLSRWIPRRIVYCAESARRFHDSLGYDGTRSVVIPNGFDLDAFKPDPVARREVREELGLGADALLVGLVARTDGIKNHPFFFRAAAQILQRVPNVHFVVCGDDVQRFQPLCDERGIASRCRLMGYRRDIARIDAALDLACSTSYTEGFSNSIGEAMAAGVPCVVTNAGDSALLVGDAGVVVGTHDEDAFVRACVELLEAPEMRRDLGERARARIAAHYGVESIVRQYERVYEEVVQKAKSR